MNTRLLMRASAALMAGLGVATSFLPQEILTHFGAAPGAVPVVLIQITGALYIGFAMLNWMAQGSVMGGIYSRPVTVANVAHFTIGALALVKIVASGARAPEVVAGAAVYVVLAVLFAVVLFTHPTPDAQRPT